MTKGAALQQFFSQFLTAYTATSVPEDVIFPYLTYDAVFDAWGGEPVSLTVNLWFYTESEAVPNAKADEISKALEGGAVLDMGNGEYIVLHRGSPWCQALRDETNNNVKRRYLNVTANYLCHF